jgi:NAD(P)-dependent dehydrogenase (short-subunit alcohol dehydrogenase family)
MRALVTGAARGLGAAVADRIARDGGAVAYVDVLEQVRATAAAAGERAHGFVCDISDEAAVQATVDAAVAALGGLDLLVNCAGIGGPADAVADLSLKDFNKVVDVNLKGTFLMARAAARVLTEQGSGGVIVNVGSLFGQQGVGWGGAYCASKGGIELLTHSLAHELGSHGIRVNTIAPGFMANDLHYEELHAQAARSGRAFDDILADEIETVPLRRLGTGEDVAGTVVWLASEDSAYVTGQTIALNGGVLMS